MTATIDKSNERVRSMFAEIAGGYDRMNHLLSMNVDKYWRWRTVRMVPPQGSAPILDLCTGTGDLALAYWKATERQKKASGDNGVTFTAADFCPEMLEVGRGKKQHLGIGDQLKFVEADAQDLPFPDDHYQIVCVAFGLRNVTDTDLGLREMTRVCQNGGRVAVLEFSQPQMQPIKAIYGWYFRNSHGSGPQVSRDHSGDDTPRESICEMEVLCSNLSVPKNRGKVYRIL